MDRREGEGNPADLPKNKLTPAEYIKWQDRNCEKFEQINNEFRCGAYMEIEDLDDQLEKYKKKFVNLDLDGSGDLGIMGLKMLMEDLGQAKTHAELKKMIKEVDKTNKGAISYFEFLEMMLGKNNSILKTILMFEEMAKEKPRPTGVPPKKTFDQLP